PVGIEADAFANGVFVGEETARQSLVDDDDTGRVGVVLRAQTTTKLDRNFHRLEKISADNMDISRARIIPVSVLPRQIKPSPPTAAGEQRVAREGDRTHAGHGFNPIEHPLIELR